MEERISIAIDGPAGAGKSTTARRVAAALGFVYVDSGAMYRAVALKSLEHGIDLTDSKAVSGIAGSADIVFLPPRDESVAQRMVLDGVDVTDAIRTSQVSQGASSVSIIPRVREILVAKQRVLGKGGGVVMEGRDIGTVVLPEAKIKIFLTASLEERARRRFLEGQLKGMADLTIENVTADIAERDHRDTTRKISPLVCASDAVVLQTDNMNIDQVVTSVLDLVHGATKGNTA